MVSGMVVVGCDLVVSSMIMLVVNCAMVIGCVVAVDSVAAIFS